MSAATVATSPCRVDDLDALNKVADKVPDTVPLVSHKRDRESLEQPAKKKQKVTEQTVPEETVPTVPEQTVPEGTVPEQTVPEGTVPTVPDESGNSSGDDEYDSNVESDEPTQLDWLVAHASGSSKVKPTPLQLLERQIAKLQQKARKTRAKQKAKENYERKLTKNAVTFKGKVLRNIEKIPVQASVQSKHSVQSYALHMAKKTISEGTTSLIELLRKAFKNNEVGVEAYSALTTFHTGKGCKNKKRDPDELLKEAVFNWFKQAVKVQEKVSTDSQFTASLILIGQSKESSDFFVKYPNAMFSSDTEAEKVKLLKYVGLFSKEDKEFLQAVIKENLKPIIKAYAQNKTTSSDEEIEV